METEKLSFDLQSYFDEIERDNLKQFGLGSNPTFDLNDDSNEAEQTYKKQELGEEQDFNLDDLEEEKTKSKKRVTKSQRLQKRNQTLEDENRELKRKILEQENVLTNSAAQNVTEKFNLISSQLAALDERKKDLLDLETSYINKSINARYAGDPELEKDFEFRRSALRNSLSNLDKEKDILQNDLNYLRGAAQTIQEKYNAPSGIQEEFRPEVEDLFQTFPFLDQRHNNPNYSPQAFAKAHEVTAKMNQRYKIEGRGEDIYGEDYMNELKSHLRKEFNLSNSQRRQPSTRIVTNPNPRYSVGLDVPEPNLSEVEKQLLQNASEVFTELGFGDQAQSLKSDAMKIKRESDYDY